MEKLEQDPNNPHGFHALLITKRSDDYIFDHLTEHGTPQEWLDYAQDVKKIPFINSGMPKSYFDQFQGSVDGMLHVMLSETYASDGRIWGLEETLGFFHNISFVTFYDYHLFALKYAVQFVKENGFAPKRDLEQMEKGFLEWKKEEPHLQALLSQYLPLEFQLAKLEGEKILSSNELDRQYGLNLTGYSCFDTLPYDAVWGKDGSVHPPDSNLISKNSREECRAVQVTIWQTLHEIAQIKAEATFLGYRQFFRMFGTTPPVMNKVPGAGSNEIP